MVLWSLTRSKLMLQFSEGIKSPKSHFVYKKIPLTTHYFNQQLSNLD